MAWNYGKRYAEYIMGYRSFGVDIIFAALSPLLSVVGWLRVLGSTAAAVGIWYALRCVLYCASLRAGG